MLFLLFLNVFLVLTNSHLKIVVVNFDFVVICVGMNCCGILLHKNECCFFLGAIRASQIIASSPEQRKPTVKDLKVWH